MHEARRTRRMKERNEMCFRDNFMSKNASPLINQWMADSEPSTLLKR